MTSTSYLVYRLTGRVVMDHYTAAAYGPLYNLHSRRWDRRALDLVCDEALLPELGWTATVAGPVSREAARQTGLAEGTPVTVGTADAAAEAMAAGILAPGDTMLMYGTTLFLIQVCSRLPSSRSQWPTVYLEADTFALAAGMSTTGALTKWFRDSFARRELEREQGGGVNAYQALAEAASRVPRGSDGLLVLPFFSGERTPVNDPLARGMIAGLTLSHGQAHLFRAILESIAFGVRHNLEAMEEAGFASRRLVAIGGGVQNRLWTRIVSDVTGREQEVRETPGACYGDAMIGAVAAGILPGLSDARKWLASASLVRPDPEAHAFYTRRYPLYRELYDRTKDLVHLLASGAGP
jgi:xylulokinase